MPRKSFQKTILEEIKKVIGDVEDITLEGDTLEIPLELVDNPKFEQLEEILRKHNYYVSVVSKNVITFRRYRGKVKW